MKKILILCSGNSSRSQMAEGYLNFYAREKADFYSAGLEDRGVNPLTVKVMAEDNIDISGSRSKSYKVFGKLHFDYLLTVCDEAQQQLPREISFNEHFHFSIPDPDKDRKPEAERQEIFCQVREQVKINILKFIGKELSGNQELEITYT